LTPSIATEISQKLTLMVGMHRLSAVLKIPSLSSSRTQSGPRLFEVAGKIKASPGSKPGQRDFA
jgi:hypothetical protein